MSERDEQKRFFQHLKCRWEEDPRLKYGVFAIPNGQWYGRTKSKKSAQLAAMAKAEGMLPGVWDVFCAIPMDKEGTLEELIATGYFSDKEAQQYADGWVETIHYPGMWIEFKFGKNKLTANQQAFREFIVSQGYAAAAAYSWREAANTLADYLELDLLRVKQE